MSKLVRFPNLREARREAAEWVARVDRGLSAEERTALHAWASSPLNKRALREMAALWNDLGVLRTLSELFPLESAGRAAPGRPVPWFAVGVAASLALAVAAGVLFERRAASPPAVAQAVVPVERLETPVGQSRTVALRDGSAVVLNTDTALSVSIGAGHRDLRLARGEAHFRVAHDASTPFRVYVNGARVQAVGTEFGVRLRESGQIDVLVTEGTVRVESEAGDSLPPRLVSAHQALSLDGARRGDVRDVAPADIDVRLAWQRGMLIFRGEPLETVLAEFARYTTQPFVVTDPQLQRVRVGGYFRAGDVDGLLVALRENFRIVAMRDDRGRILLSAPP